MFGLSGKLFAKQDADLTEKICYTQLQLVFESSSEKLDKKK
jgi:hypothetical protein